MTTQHTTASGAADRVNAYLDRRATMRSIDPEVVHGIDGPDFELTVSDLRALAASAPVAPTKMPIPPSPADPLDVVYVEGWNAACEAFFGGKPPADALVITVAAPVAPAPQPVGAGEQSLRNAFGVWAETQGNGEVSLLDVLSPIEAEAAFDNWKLTLVAPTQAEFALRALVAAGFVTQAKVDEAMTLPGAPPAAEPVAEVKELFIPATGATAKAAHLMDTSLPGGTMLYTAPPAPTEQWIGVTERLPEWVHRDDTPCHINGKEVPPTLTSKTVLVALDGGGVRTDKLTTIEGKSNGWWRTFGERVIAWQDTPAPPQGAANKDES